MINYGRIFVPQDYGLEYSKSPQAMVFDDFVRIYFSYCIPDGDKLISRVAYVDFDKTFNTILNVSKTVISDGKLGTYDEHGIFPFSPFWDGKEIKALISGWTRRVSVSADSGIGLAISSDGGKTFERYGDGPIMTACLDEPYLVDDGFLVVADDGTYVMYYIFGTNWANYGTNEPERTYRIGIAKSKNLLDWERSGRQILMCKSLGEAQALPTVLKHNGRWHMAFCYRDTVGFRENSKNAYRIGYASSTDMWNWDRDDSKISIPIEGWCAEMQCYPNLFEMDGGIYLLYNGNHFAKEGFGLIKLEGL